MPAPLHRLEQTVTVDRPLAQVFPFFSDPRNLERLTPPFLRFQVLAMSGGDRAHEGQVIDYRLRVRGLPLRWRTLITRWDPPHGFVDVAAHSPYAFWHHTHRFRPKGRRTEMTDTVLFSLPFHPLGEWLAGRLVQADVEQIFAYRSRAIAEIFPPRGR